MLPVPRQSRAESPEVVLLAVEDQTDDHAAWGLRLHGLPPTPLFSHLRNGMIRFLPSRTSVPGTLMRNFCLSSYSLDSVLGTLVQLPLGCPLTRNPRAQKARCPSPVQQLGKREGGAGAGAAGRWGEPEKGADQGRGSVSGALGRGPAAGSGTGVPGSGPRVRVRFQGLGSRPGAPA